MFKTTAKQGMVLQGYFRIERLLPVSMRREAVQSKGAPGGGWPGAPRPDLLPGMSTPRVKIYGRVVQARSNDGVATALLPNGQLRLIGNGKPLDLSIQRSMEALFDTNFSDVRVHEGPAVQAMGAMAVTLGETLYFAPGVYDPTTREGLRLLGHELTHVVQQREGRVKNPYGLGVAIVQDPALEAEADLVGEWVADAIWSGSGGGEPRPRTGFRPAVTQISRSSTAQPMLDDWRVLGAGLAGLVGLGGYAAYYFWQKSRKQAPAEARGGSKTATTHLSLQERARQIHAQQEDAGGGVEKVLAPEPTFLAVRNPAGAKKQKKKTKIPLSGIWDYARQKEVEEEEEEEEVLAVERSKFHNQTQNQKQTEKLKNKKIVSPIPLGHDGVDIKQDVNRHPVYFCWKTSSNEKNRTLEVCNAYDKDKDIDQVKNSSYNKQKNDHTIYNSGKSAMPEIIGCIREWDDGKGWNTTVERAIFHAHLKPGDGKLLEGHTQCHIKTGRYSLPPHYRLWPASPVIPPEVVKILSKALPEWDVKASYLPAINRTRSS